MKRLALIGACAAGLALARPRAAAPDVPLDAASAAAVRPTVPAVREKPSGEWPMYGGTLGRNMLSPGERPPLDWDVESGRNIKWKVPLGSQTYAPPIVAGGVIYIGTNNEAHYDPAERRDGGVLLAFDEQTGRFLWQRFLPKLPAGRVNDWPYQGQPGTPVVERGRLWYATSRCETVCLDVSGDQPKVVWSVDMIKELGVFPHNMTRCHPALWRDRLYVITGNGVDETHAKLPAPDAPSIVCFDKNTGRVLWSDRSPGLGILHGQWASPAVAEAGGQTLVIAPLGDGWVYAYDAVTGRVVWKFDTNPKDTVYPRTRNELLATPVIYQGHMYLATGQDPEHGEGPGRIWCVDIGGTGDVSDELAGEELPFRPGEFKLARGIAGPRKGIPNPNSAVRWRYEGADLDGNGKIRGKEQVNRTISTVAIANDLVFVADFTGFLHCFGAGDGRLCWTYDMEAAMWEGPLAVDGKIYLGDEDGDVVVFAASDKLTVLAEKAMDNAIYAPPVFANGVLYLTTKDKLFAIQAGE